MFIHFSLLLRKKKMLKVKNNMEILLRLKKWFTHQKEFFLLAVLSSKQWGTEISTDLVYHKYIFI